MSLQHHSNYVYLIFLRLLWLCSCSLLTGAQPPDRPLSVIPVGHLLKRLLELHLTKLTPGWLARQCHRLIGEESDSHFFKAAGMKVSHLPQERIHVDNIRQGK